MKRIVKVEAMNCMGVSLEVTFPEVKLNKLGNLNTRYRTICLSDPLKVTSEYFGDVAKARAWVEELTKEATELEALQREKLQEFELLAKELT